MSLLSSFYNLGSGARYPYYNEASQEDGYVSDRYYPPSLNADILRSGNFTADVIYFVPFMPFEDQTFTKIVIVNWDTGDTGDHIRLGVYDDYYGLPGDLNLDAGVVIIDGTAAAREITISLTVTRGELLWLAAIGDADTKIHSMEMTAPPLMSYGIESVLTNSTTLASFEKSIPVKSGVSYGALPLTAGVNSYQADFIPLICLGV